MVKITTKQKVYDLFVNDWYAFIESSEKALFIRYLKLHLDMKTICIKRLDLYWFIS